MCLRIACGLRVGCVCALVGFLFVARVCLRALVGSLRVAHVCVLVTAMAFNFGRIAMLIMLVMSSEVMSILKLLLVQVS